MCLTQLHTPSSKPDTVASPFCASALLLQQLHTLLGLVRAQGVVLLVVLQRIA